MKRDREYRPREEVKVEWVPKSKIGKMVFNGEINDINELFDKGYSIREEGISDKLLPGLESDLILIGQSKGKFGGGKRRAFKQNQKKTEDGNKISFRAMVVVGNKNGVVGVGEGRSIETVPSREKAHKHAKKNLMRINMGCGSWECNCGGKHSIPFAVEGKCGSVRIKLIPAPKGVGLCVHRECQKVLQLAGIKDVWSTSEGNTRTTINLINALTDALKKLSIVKVSK